MGDSGVVFSSFGYLFVVAMLLNYSGLTQVGVPTIPGGSPNGIDNNGQPTTKSAVATFVDCWANIIADATIVVPIIWGIAGKNPIDITEKACNQRQSSPLGDLLTNVGNGLTTSVVFLYQLVTFSIPNVPVILNLIILVPPGVTLVYIGFKLIRGTGG